MARANNTHERMKNAYEIVFGNVERESINL